MNADYLIIPHPYPINNPEGLDRVCSPNEWPRRTQHLMVPWYTADLYFNNEHNFFWHPLHW